MAKVVRMRDYDGPADKAPPLEQEDGSSFGWYERLFLSWRDGKVLDYSDWHARDLEDALSRDYKMRQLERVLVGPIEAAAPTDESIVPLKGDAGEADWVRNHLLADEFDGGIETPIELVWSQMTSAIGYRKAFFELVWTILADGSVGYRKIAYRPATTCRMRREPTGQFAGFEQEGFYMGPSVETNKWPIVVEAKRAFVYIHGQRRDPMNGVSDLDVPYWCYKTKQKILFLWFQYAEQVSLPRVTVTANDLDTAKSVAAQGTRLKSSGWLPLSVPGGPSQVAVAPLDISGKGGEQFMAIVNWLDQAAANSALAGFTNLTDMESGKWGGALSSDASDFYLQTREAAKKEQQREFRSGIIAPALRYNFGPQARIPKMQVEPLNSEDKSQQITMLSDLMRSRDPALVPDEFIEELVADVAGYWGMPVDQLRKAFKDAAAQAKAAAAASGLDPSGQAVAGVAGGVNALGTAVKRVGGPKIPGINSPQLPRSY